MQSRSTCVHQPLTVERTTLAYELWRTRFPFQAARLNLLRALVRETNAFGYGD